MIKNKSLQNAWAKKLPSLLSSWLKVNDCKEMFFLLNNRSKKNAKVTNCFTKVCSLLFFKAEIKHWESPSNSRLCTLISLAKVTGLYLLQGLLEPTRSGGRMRYIMHRVHESSLTWEFTLMLKASLTWERPLVGVIWLWLVWYECMSLLLWSPLSRATLLITVILDIKLSLVRCFLFTVTFQQSNQTKKK